MTYLIYRLEASENINIPLSVSNSTAVATKCA